MIYDLSSLTPRQREIIEQVLARTKFDWKRLVPKLQAEKNKSQIPVEWTDLSRYMAQASRKKAGHHHHLHIAGDTAHPIEFRNKVLGLAWYSGKISLDISLESDPLLAQEVFLAEGAHMVDFFYMTDEERKAIFDAYHDGNTDDHGHDWFDKGTYWDWAGESFMGGFTLAYSDLLPSMGTFTHPSTPQVAQKIRTILDRTPPEPEKPQAPEKPYGATNKSKVFHWANHLQKRWQVTFASASDAKATGRRACKQCKPV